MKVYLLYSLYYDFCEEWPTLLGIYDSEDKAIYAQIEEEMQSKYENTEQFHTTIYVHELL